MCYIKSSNDNLESGDNLKSGHRQQKADRRFNSLKAIKNDQAKVIPRRRALRSARLKKFIKIRLIFDIEK